MKEKEKYSIVRVNRRSDLYYLLKDIEVTLRLNNPTYSNANFYSKLEQVVVKLLMENEERLFFLDLKRRGKIQDALKDHDYSNPMINIHSDVWRDEIGRKYWYLIKKELVKWRVIQSSRSYCNNPKYSVSGRVYPMSYRLRSEYAGEENFELSRRDDYPQKELRWDLFTPEEKIKWEKVTLDKDFAWDELKKSKNRLKWTYAQYCYQACQVMSFNVGHKPPSSCSTNREFNGINQLPREVRTAVRIKGETVVDLDLKSSQPTILYRFIEDSDERREYKRLIEDGILYEEIIPYLDGYSDHDYKAYDERDMAKLCFCKLVGGAVIKRNRRDPKNNFKKYRQTTGAGLCARFFLERFPKLYRKMRKINFQNRGELVRELQRIEASIVVEGMKASGILTVSIHDGILVQASKAQQAHDFLSKKFTEVVGIVPVITGLEQNHEVLEDDDPDYLKNLQLFLDRDDDEIIEFIPQETEPLTADDIFGAGA